MIADNGTLEVLNACLKEFTWNNIIFQLYRKFSNFFDLRNDWKVVLSVCVFQCAIYKWSLEWAYRFVHDTSF